MHRNPLVNFLYKSARKYPTPVNLSFTRNSPKTFVPVRFHGSNKNSILSTVKVPSSGTPKIHEKSTFYTPTSGNISSNTQVYCPSKSPQSTVSSKSPVFFNHNTIKETISPYESAPVPDKGQIIHKPVITTVEHLPSIAQSSAYSSTISSSLLSHITSVNTYNTMGLSVFTKILSQDSFIPEVKITKVPEIKNPLVIDTSKNLHPSNEELFNSLNSISSPPPSPFVPENCSEENFVLACNIYAHIYCVKQGMPLPIATIITGFKHGTPSMNIKELSRLVKVPYFKDPMNFIPYIHEDNFNTLENSLQKHLSELSINNVTTFHEIAGAGEVNKNLLYPLKFNTHPSAVKSKDNAETSKNGLENLTNQRNPDFLRDFPNPIWGIKTQAYDQKSYSPSAPMKDCNHLRVTTDKLGKLTTAAIDKLKDKIQNPSYDFGDDDFFARELLSHLSNIKDIYKKTNNPRDFNKSYNKIRDHEVYNAFLIKHKIPMNLVTQVSLENFNLQENHIHYFNEVFKQAYYSPNSPVVPIIKKVIAEKNGPISDLNHVYKLILEAVFTPPTH